MIFQDVRAIFDEQAQVICYQDIFAVSSFRGILTVLLSLFVPENDIYQTRFVLHCQQIQVRVHTSKAGLGAMASMPMDFVQNTKKISMNWKKAHERFQSCNPLYEGEESIDDLARTKIQLERKKWVQGETEVLGELKKGTETSVIGLVEPKEKEDKEEKGAKPVKVDIFEDD